MTFLQELSWKQLPYFNLAPREAISINGTISGYRQSFQNFTFWNILRAGHLVSEHLTRNMQVPLDAPQMAYYMFNSIIYPNMTESQLLSLL